MNTLNVSTVHKRKHTYLLHRAQIMYCDGGIFQGQQVRNANYTVNDNCQHCCLLYIHHCHIEAGGNAALLLEMSSCQIETSCFESERL